MLSMHVSQHIDSHNTQLGHMVWPVNLWQHGTRAPQIFSSHPCCHTVNLILQFWGNILPGFLSSKFCSLIQSGHFAKFVWAWWLWGLRQSLLDWNETRCRPVSGQPFVATCSHLCTTHISCVTQMQHGVDPVLDTVCPVSCHLILQFWTTMCSNVFPLMYNTHITCYTDATRCRPGSGHCLSCVMSLDSSVLDNHV